ncbi:MAG: metal ABC transporter solute-binding protein, Zn/Mn family [Rubricella sp.]
MSGRSHGFGKVLAAASIATVAALSPLAATAQDGQVTIVATTGMIADAAREIGGDRADVTALMGPGIDPHAYRQTRSDIAAMTRADLVLWNGLYLEAQLEEFLLDLEGSVPVVAVAEEGVPVEARIGHDDYEGRFDPHVWMDPDLWSGVVASVRDAMIAVDPEGAEAYAANAAAYLEEVAALADYARTVLESVPEESRVLISAHDAFNYFGAAYGFEVVGIQGISTESEAGLARIEELVSMLVERDIRAVFVESSVSDRNIRALIEGAAAQGHTVSVGGELFSDAMGEPGTYEGTWLGMIDHNATVIARALGGEAPERGRLGTLSAGM